MRKILTVLALALCLSSCVISADKNEAEETVNDNINHIKYNGHNYLLLMVAYGNVGYAGLEHDPDCPCNINRINREIKDGNDTTSIHNK